MRLGMFSFNQFSFKITTFGFKTQEEKGTPTHTQTRIKLKQFRESNTSRIRATYKNEKCTHAHTQTGIKLKEYIFTQDFEKSTSSSLKLEQRGDVEMAWSF